MRQVEAQIIQQQQPGIQRNQQRQLGTQVKVQIIQR